LDDEVRHSAEDKAKMKHGTCEQQKFSQKIVEHIELTACSATASKLERRA